MNICSSILHSAEAAKLRGSLIVRENLPLDEEMHSVVNVRNNEVNLPQREMKDEKKKGNVSIICVVYDDSRGHGCARAET